MAYAAIGFWLASAAAYITHIAWLVSSLVANAFTGGKVILGILGLLFPPVGVIHGFGIWFFAGFW